MIDGEHKIIILCIKVKTARLVTAMTVYDSGVKFDSSYVAVFDFGVLIRKITIVKKYGFLCERESQQIQNTAQDENQRQYPPG